MIGRRIDRPRRGMLAIAVLICLIVLAMIAGAILRAGTAQREEVRDQERGLQADWLAEAGLQRALARLAADPAYHGETWEIDARALDSAEPATVVIAVERPTDDPRRRTIRARADYPRDAPRRARRTRQITTPVAD
jgi:Tfp pilus assembly protein PilX